VQRRLLDNMDRARELGAEVVRLKGSDAVATMLEFAQTHRVSDLIVGRTAQPWWRRLLGRSVLQRLVEGAAGIDLHVISFTGGEEGAA